MISKQERYEFRKIRSRNRLFEHGIKMPRLSVYRGAKHIYAQVVDGGKRFSFNALVVVGDNNGKVGVGLGKSNEVQGAIQKGTAGARKDMFQFPLENSTIPHEVEGKFGAGK